MGGFVKQYQVLVEPAMLRKYNLTLHEVFDAIANNNANAGFITSMAPNALPRFLQFGLRFQF